MNDLLRFITSNYIINVGVVSFMSAQLIKTILILVFTRRLVFERLIGAGGMPSSHSALVTSIAIAMVNKMGYASPVSGLAFAFAIIVMYDAMGVRRAAGEQAKVINRLVFRISDSFPFLEKSEEGEDPEECDDCGKHPPLMTKELKEFLGHTPLEVLGGCLLGILVAMFMPVV